MERFYGFADCTFRIAGDDGDIYLEDGALAPFRVEGPGFDHSITYRIVDSLPVPEGEPVFRGQGLQVFRLGQAQTICMDPHTQIRREGSHSLVQVLREKVPERIHPRYVLNTLEVEHHMARHRAILLHSSFIRWGGRAILFTAPSGTGKSTQAALWQKYRGAEVINGDRTAVTVGPEGVLAHGIPYCGTSGISGPARLPLAAIVYLSQGPESRAMPLTGLRAFRRVWEGCSVHTWDREDVEAATDTVMEVIRRVPVIHLSCTPDESAVAALEAYLKKEE